MANKLDFVTTNNEVDALLLEQNLIKSEKPKFNILLRDDKSYPFIHLDENHDFPKIQTKRVLKGHEGLYGPYTSAYATRIAVNQIQKVFKIRTCSDNYFKNSIKAMYGVSNWSVVLHPVLVKLIKQNTEKTLKIPKQFLRAISNI